LGAEAAAARLENDFADQPVEMEDRSRAVDAHPRRPDRQLIACG